MPTIMQQMQIGLEAALRSVTICIVHNMPSVNKFTNLLDSLKAFPKSLSHMWEANRLEYLIRVTHRLGDYRLVLKQGEPFTPVILRVHGDPISILGKVLDQNPRSYTKINEFVDLGHQMAMAGLTFRDTAGHTLANQMTDKQVEEQKTIVEMRVISMCVDAALAEDDFETAYSFVTTHLVKIARPAQERSPDHDRTGGLFAEVPPKTIDDWSWRAALQAGKYRRTSQTIRPTHFGNASGNVEIRHLEQRMDCLSHALRLAPRFTLQEILNVFRRCEEELDSHSRQEAEEEAACDAQLDEQAIPGGFRPDRRTKEIGMKQKSRAMEEAPISLFDLSRATVVRAQSGFGLSILNRNTTAQQNDQLAQGAESSQFFTADAGVPKSRKRDQLRDAAVGTLASGIGWLVGAPPISQNEFEHDDE
jgi:hypothetical protein